MHKMARLKGAESRRPPNRKAEGARAGKAGATRPAAVSGGSRLLTVACVGASAGGLEAFSQLLQALPADLGMAIVFIQHLAPKHESALPTLLANVSALPVVSASEGMRVEADHVYVIPPNARLGISAGDLHLSTRPSDASQYHPIDFFLRSLADSVGERSIAVILSGTASDGAAGVCDVKAAGGIAIAQLPETAKYDGMPRAAIATDRVDLVLSPADIAARLVEIARHGHIRDVSAAAGSPAPPTPSIPEEQLQIIFAQLRSVSGVDFSEYKLPTIARRLQRRMALHKLARVSDYLQYIHDHPPELQDLHQDILIHVTRFFREPESFDALRERVFPRLLENRVGETPIRIWVCGCATGEEAYSVAIALLEFLGDDSPGVPIQVFATDVSGDAIQKARGGIYPEEIRADVSPERLRRFFVHTDRHYRIGKWVRDVCIFAQQDITRDPPFSRLDLVLCRNVLIYMTAPLQRRLMGVFHYALRPDGFLVLGHAETVGAHGDLFRILDKQHRIYVRKPGKIAPDLGRMPQFAPSIPARQRRVPTPGRSDAASMQSEADRFVMEHYAPAGAVVDAEFRIVEFRGQTGAYLGQAPGEATLSILKMAREGLLYELRTALHGARKRNARVRREGLLVDDGTSQREVNLEVIPLGPAERHHFLVLFEDVRVLEQRRVVQGKTKRSGTKTGSSDDRQRVARLEQELSASREYLESIIQELEGANEELQSANEEILSSNEELQSSNEELDTTKEELQSTNEELNTLNEELHGRNEELSLANSDLVNLIGSVDIAIVIVTSDLRIRRFTPMAERVLNLRGGDVGRPLHHIKPDIDCPDLEDLARESIDRVVSQEREVQDRDGKWYSLRFRPYKNLENRIDGAVLILFDIDAAKRHEAAVRLARDTSQAIVEALREPVLLLDRALRVKTVNGAFCTQFGVRRESLENQPFFESVARDWDAEGLREALGGLASGEGVDGFDLTVPGRGGKSQRVRVGARGIAAVGDGVPTILLLVEESPNEAAAPNHTRD